jgi:hypothetical protein
MFRIFERILAFFVLFPPVFMAIRYVRWYLRQRPDEQKN